MWDLSSPTWIELGPPALEAWIPNYWAAREVPTDICSDCLISLPSDLYSEERMIISNINWAVNACQALYQALYIYQVILSSHCLYGVLLFLWSKNWGSEKLSNLPKVTLFFSNKQDENPVSRVSKIFALYFRPGERLREEPKLHAGESGWRVWWGMVCKEGQGSHRQEPCLLIKKTVAPQHPETPCEMLPEPRPSWCFNSSRYPFTLESSGIWFICQQRDGQLFWKPTQQAPIFTSVEVIDNQQLCFGEWDFYCPG